MEALDVVAERDVTAEQIVRPIYNGRLDCALDILIDYLLQIGEEQMGKDEPDCHDGSPPHDDFSLHPFPVSVPDPSNAAVA